MSELDRLGNQISISIPLDENGFMGRECPDCERYFKIKPGTGLVGENLPCHCPYCGHSDPQDHFWTKAQIEYAQSIAARKVMAAVQKDLKKLEFDIKPRGAFGIGISMSVEPGSLPSVRHYAEKHLETDVICDHCTLFYTIYGVFAFCPDCRTHNSTQILGTNLELAEKLLSLAGQTDTDVAQQLVADALENAVSAFDGFGREACRVHAAKAIDPSKAEAMSFQNLGGAQKNLRTLFGFDVVSGVQPDEWKFLCQSFQKRHLFAHKMGIVDQHYVDVTADMGAAVGRKIVVTGDEVKRLLLLVRQLGNFLVGQLR